MPRPQPTTTVSAPGPIGRRAPQIRVSIVDDHAIVRNGLLHLIEGEADMTVLAQFASADDVPEPLADAMPDVMIVDLSLGTASGLDLIKRLVAANPTLHVLVLSMHDETVYAERALHAGATGYVMKHEATRELLNAVRQVARGHVYVSKRMSEHIVSQLRHDNAAPNGLSRLTDRERHVLELIGRGLSTREIADQLGVSVKTIESHQLHLRDKLSLKNGRHLLRFAASWIEHV